MTNKFESLQLKSELLENLKTLDFNEMTPIQKESLPIILNGRDVIAKAKTGSGKTAAFGLGILNKLNSDQKIPQALVLCPTRELADQVAAELRNLARSLTNIKIITICGGIAEFHQDNSLAHGAHIVVGTPGRVLKLLKKETLNISKIDTFVLDEADRILDMGFMRELKEIRSYLPTQRQSLLFSATFPYSIQDLSKDVQTDAVSISIDTAHEKNVITQKFYKLVSHKDKNAALLALLGELKPESFLVFCKTKIIADSVAKLLDNNKILAAAIHGDHDQNERTAVLTMFSNNSLSGLVATDVAARGLDIKNLSAVINYDLPMDPQDYVHRIGRTGRAGEKGDAVSFYIEQEDEKFKRIEEYTKSKIRSVDFFADDYTKEYDLMPPMDTIYIGGGKKDKLRPGDIVGALIHEAGLSADDIGDISINSITSYVALKKETVETAVFKLNSGKIKNRKFKVGLA